MYPPEFQAAQDARETLSSLRENVERYLRIRLAAEILQAEIERRQELSQGPVLRCAGELFALITEEHGKRVKGKLPIETVNHKHKRVI